MICMLGQEVKKRRKAKNLSQSELANIARCSQQDISHVETGRVVQPRKLWAIARALETTVPELYGQPPASAGPSVKFLDTRATVPILSWNMATSWAKGVAHELPEGLRTEYHRGGSRTFALEVQGESMIGPKLAFLPGELVHIDPDQTDPQMDAFVLAELEDGQPTFKQLKFEDGRWYLSSLNPHFYPIFGDFLILGRAVAKTMDL